MQRLEHLITSAYNSLPLEMASNCQTVTENAQSCFDCLQKQFFNGNMVDYHCAEKKKAYIVRYLPVHVREVEKAYELLPDQQLEELLKKERIKVLSIGGGPGSDIAATLKFLHRHIRYKPHEMPQLYFERLDQEESWGDLSPAVTDVYRHEANIEISNSCYDIAKQAIIRVERFDICTLSYVLSEIEDNDIPQVAANLKNSVNTANSGIILINDRDQVEVVERIRMLIGILGATNVQSCRQQEWAGFSYPDHIKEIAGPKLSTSSIRCCLVLNP